MFTSHLRDRVLVTGAGGFIGSHLLAALAQSGCEVVALDLDLERVRHLEGAAQIELLEGDVGDPALVERALEGVRTVFHLAAAHLGVTAPDSEYWRINVEAVESLTSAALEAGVGRFVHCSSVGVYGRVERPPADEDSPCHPDLVYERTKLAGEKVVLEAIRDHGLPAVVLRPAWVYGPGCPRTEKLFRAAVKGRLLMAGRGSSLRHCLYIRDMIEALQLAATKDDAIGQILIIGDESAVTVRQLLEEVARTANSRPPRSVPLILLSAVAVATELAFRLVGREPVISRRSMRFFTGNTAFDTTRAKNLLGFESRYDLERGLRETYELVSARRPWRISLTDYPADYPAQGD